MQPLLCTLLFGFFLWLTTFFSAFFIFTLKESNPPFFETLISIFLASFTVLYGWAYFKNARPDLSTAIKVGLIWAAVNVAIDLPLFSFGPMKKPLWDYFTDIGFTYLMIPVILIAFAERKGKS